MSFINKLYNFINYSPTNNINDYNVQVGHGDTHEKNIFDIATDTNTFNNSWEKVAVVYTCWRILAETIARTPLHIYRKDKRGNKVKAKEHHLYKLLHFAPNNFQTHYTFTSTLETVRNNGGNSYARIWTDGNKKETAFEIIPASAVKDADIKKGKLYYKIQLPDQKKAIGVSAEEIIHFKGISSDGVFGLSPIEAIRRNVKINEMAAQTIEKLYKKNMFGKKALQSTIGNVKQEDLIEAVEKLEKKYLNISSDQIIPLLPNTELKDLQMSVEQMDFINTMNWGREVISSIYGIPLYLLGDTSAFKYSTVEQTQLNFKVNTIAPILRMYREELEFKLLTDKERELGYSIEFNVDALIETDYTTKINGLSKMIEKAMLSPNQANEIMGFPSFEGGDKHLIQGQMLFLEDIAAGTQRPIDGSGQSNNNE